MVKYLHICTVVLLKTFGCKLSPISFAFPESRFTVWAVFKMFLGSSTPKACSLRLLYQLQCALCLLVVCCGRGLTLTLSQSLQSLSSGHTGKMVKKVCPCNQLCSNYLSFWSFLPPSIHNPTPPSLHLLSHAPPPPLSDAPSIKTCQI